MTIMIMSNGACCAAAIPPWHWRWAEAGRRGAFPPGGPLAFGCAPRRGSGHAPPVDMRRMPCTWPGADACGRVQPQFCQRWICTKKHLRLLTSASFQGPAVGGPASAAATPLSCLQQQHCIRHMYIGPQTCKDCVHGTKVWLCTSRSTTSAGACTKTDSQTDDARASLSMSHSQWQACATTTPSSPCHLGSSLPTCN